MDNMIQLSTTSWVIIRPLFKWDCIEPGQTGDFFFSSYITDFKILIWYSKSTQMFYVKCMSYIPSLFIACPATIK